MSQFFGNQTGQVRADGTVVGRWSGGALSLQLGPWLLVALAAMAGLAQGAVVTVRTNQIGATPDLLGYNSGHFFPGSNTRDWWRYAGVTGARLFISPAEIEAEDDLPGHGDGVTNEASFLLRKAALRVEPLDTNYIYWPSFNRQFEDRVLAGANKLQVNHACRELRRLGVRIAANISASPSVFPLAGANDWPGKWELWQHYYAQAFHLGREFEVQRYQMFNEPNHSSAGGLTTADYLVRLQLAADAIASALADVSQRHGKNLKPLIMAPVTAGSAASSYSPWGETVVTNRHLNFLGRWDLSFSLAGLYDYHQYNSTPAQFGASLADLRAALAAAMAPSPPWPATISEFNVHTAATFDGMAETLDTPAKFARLGAILVNLAGNDCREMYLFKFSQTFSDGTIKKNGLHYVDNFNAPYQVGGLTRGGEVWRLFNQAAAPGGRRLEVARGPGAEALDVFASFFPNERCCRVFSVNNTTASLGLSFDLSAFGIPAGNRALLEEVSDQVSGAGKAWTVLGPGDLVGGVQPANSVWLLTVRAPAQEPVHTLRATGDAMVRDGAGRNVVHAGEPLLAVQNNPTNAGARCAVLLKFEVPGFHGPDLQFALLRLQAGTPAGAEPPVVHVYGLDRVDWPAETVTWADAPNLKQDIPPGAAFTNNYVAGAGESAQFLGQLTAPGAMSERLLDVTPFIRSRAGRPAAILLVREVRFAGDASAAERMEIVACEGNPDLAPRLDIVRLRDRDHDGVSDETETGSLGTSPDHPDTDGDGLTDGEELRAGTNPLNSDSTLRIEAACWDGPAKFQLAWQGVSNRTYRVFRAPDPSRSSWLLIHTQPGINGRLDFVDTQPVGPWAAYRVGVE